MVTRPKSSAMATKYGSEQATAVAQAGPLSLVERWRQKRRVPQSGIETSQAAKATKQIMNIASEAWFDRARPTTGTVTTGTIVANVGAILPGGRGPVGG